MSRDELELERWTSDDAAEEVHVFLRGERNTYVLGWNPALVDEALVRELLARLGFEFRPHCGRRPAPG